MDFSQIDMHAFLKASIPVRFQDISPYDFEKFMAELFRADGFTVEETGYSGDFGADLILTKDDERTVVQVKRYAPGSQVGVNDINQVIGARTYYRADSALVVTTSDFTNPAIALGRSAEVVLWNWQRLEKYLSSVFPDSHDYDMVFPAEPSMDPDGEVMFVLKTLQLENDVQTSGGETVHAWHFGLRNITDRNLSIHVTLPIVIARKRKRQVSAIAWKEHYFFHGVVVSGATVELACHFLKSQIETLTPVDRVVIQVHLAGQSGPVIIDQAIGRPGRNCYIVTWCFGRSSTEYAGMIALRDNILLRSRIGSQIVHMYYVLSPVLLRCAERSALVARIMRTVSRLLIRGICRLAKGMQDILHS